MISSLEVGGAETMLMRLAQATDGRLHDVLVVSMIDRGALLEPMREAGIRVETLGMRPGSPDPRGLWRLASIVRRFGPHVLQTWLYHADLLGLLCARLGAAPRLVWNIRCSDMDLGKYRWTTRLVRSILAAASARPDAVVVNSQTGRLVHERAGYRPRRWALIPNGIDLERFSPRPASERLRARLGAAPDEVLIGMAARFDPMKDHAGFLDAAAMLLRRRPATRFALAGKNVNARNDALVRMLDAHRLRERVALLGPCDDMPELLAGLDIVTSSSAFGEGFPNVLAEAMACATPCVATDVGDAARIVGDKGLVVPPSEPEALAHAWEALIDRGPEARRVLGREAREKIARDYPLARAVREYDGLYRDLLRGRQLPEAESTTS